jgi:hypothetical protein
MEPRSGQRPDLGLYDAGLSSDVHPELIALPRCQVLQLACGDGSARLGGSPGCHGGEVTMLGTDGVLSFDLHGFVLVGPRPVAVVAGVAWCRQDRLGGGDLLQADLPDRAAPVAHRLLAGGQGSASAAGSFSLPDLHEGARCEPSHSTMTWTMLFQRRCSVTLPVFFLRRRSWPQPPHMPHAMAAA